MAKTNFLVKAKNLLSNLWKKWCKLELGLRIFLVIAVILWFPIDYALMDPEEGLIYTATWKEENFIELENIVYDIVESKNLNIDLSNKILKRFDARRITDGDVRLTLEATGEKLYVTLSDDFRIKAMERNKDTAIGYMFSGVIVHIGLSLILSWIIKFIFKLFKKFVDFIKKESCQT